MEAELLSNSRSGGTTVATRFDDGAHRLLTGELKIEGKRGEVEEGDSG